MFLIMSIRLSYFSALSEPQQFSFITAHDVLCVTCGCVWYLMMYAQRVQYFSLMRAPTSICIALHSYATVLKGICIPIQTLSPGENELFLHFRPVTATDCACIHLSHTEPFQCYCASASHTQALPVKYALLRV